MTATELDRTEQRLTDDLDDGLIDFTTWARRMLDLEPERERLYGPGHQPDGNWFEDAA